MRFFLMNAYVFYVHMCFDECICEVHVCLYDGECMSGYVCL